jgi:hypothetical protein
MRIQALTAIGTSICLMMGRLINTAVESPKAYVAQIKSATKVAMAKPAG